MEIVVQTNVQLHLNYLPYLRRIGTSFKTGETQDVLSVHRMHMLKKYRRRLPQANLILFFSKLLVN
jgi:hypothetical protein